jgi:hypothetical protein
VWPPGVSPTTPGTSILVLFPPVIEP